MELRIYSVILETIGMLRTDMEVIGRRDPDLENQMRRAASSMALNTSEGSYSRGRKRRLGFTLRWVVRGRRSRVSRSASRWAICRAFAMMFVIACGRSWERSRS